MKYTKNIYLFILLAVFLLTLSACGGQTVAEAEATAAAAAAEIDPAAIFTSAAATVGAQLTETALSFSPTPLPATATPTMIPLTATLVNLNTTPLPTVAIGTLPTLAAGAPTLIPTATQVTFATTPDGPICDEMTYGSPLDITYLDGSTVTAGANFEKIWRVYNTGVCTWDVGYKLIAVGVESSRQNDPNPLDSPSTPWVLKTAVEPGGVLDIGVKLSAPITPGTYATHYVMQSDQGVNFGGVLSVYIVVK